MDLVEQLREATISAVREAGLSTAFSDGSERGAAQSKNGYPPSLAKEDGGLMSTPRDAGPEGMKQGEITQRQAPKSQGRPEFSSGGPAPTDFLVGYNASDGSRSPGSLNGPSEHVSDNGGDYRTPGAPDHVYHSLGEQLIEASGYNQSWIVRCSTCDHLKSAHPSGPCLYCGPKGSEHTFETEKDLGPTAGNLALRRPCPADPGDMIVGTIREAHYRMFDETERALIMLDEFREAVSGKVFGDHGDEPGAHSTGSQIDAARDRADDYGAHSVAAHRASLHAFMSGDKAAHNVASAAHDLACGAACKAGDDYPDSNAVGKSFRVADSYHRLQSRAHKAASNAIRVGRGSGLRSGAGFPSSGGSF